MKDTISKKAGTNSGKNRVCRVAYTINNLQPVSSTIIGTQPLFYMDYECDIDDDAVMDAADMKILENELRSLKFEIESYDKFSEQYVETPGQCYHDFVSDMDIIAKPSAKKSEASVEKIYGALGKSRLAAAYLQNAQEHNVTLSLTGQVQDAHYDRKAGKIFLNPALDFADQILLTVRELRRHWQHRQGALIHPLTFHPDSAVMINRAQIADLVVSMVRVAWELQLSGAKEGWERIENSSFNDLGRAFAREAFLDFRTINNGQAAAAVFESWFLSERARHEDKKLIQHMLADYQGYVFDLETAEQTITPALISALGSMPYGKNYLSGHVQTIMTDPIFTDVRDRSNANFLWFIKFERSFRETEQELQTGLGAMAGDVRTPVPQTKPQEAAHESQKAEIVQLFPENQKTGDKKQKGKRLLSSKDVGKGNKASAEIVYLRRWSGE
jgi:hypothetical protein